MFAPDRSWSVLASVSGAIYIESDAGDILWIAATPNALHPRAILLPAMPVELPTIGTVCCMEADYLCVGEGLTIGLGDAEIWASGLPRREGVSTSEAVRRIATAIDQAALRSTPRGLLASVLFPHAPRGGRGSRNAMEQALFTTAGRAIESLRQASSGFDLPGQLQDAIGLVGLGQGLTPSGDDLLGGFLYTLRVLDSAHWRLIGLDWEAVDEWLQQGRLLTNKISYAILTDHAHGDAAGPLQELLAAALDARFAGSLDLLVAHVAGIGQSSGWDMLIGVHCACSVAACMLDRGPVAASIPSDGVETQEMRQEPTPWEEVVRVR
jgi:hypothetical protein